MKINISIVSTFFHFFSRDLFLSQWKQNFVDIVTLKGFCQVFANKIRKK